MNRIHQMHPRRSSSQLERWWGYTRQQEVRGGTAVGKHTSGFLYVAHRKMPIKDLDTPAWMLLKTSSTQCLGSYICQVLKVIYILHWLPFFRKSK